MAGFDFPAELDVRDDVAHAHREAWVHIASPGAWWTGAQRVAIAAEVRLAAECGLCRERKAALSPYAVQGAHPPSETLCAPAIEAAHRITTDPGRLKRAWFEGLGLEAGAYTELLGVVTTIISIDAYMRGFDLPLEPLPSPRPGEPNGYRPPAVRDIGAWVPVVDAKRSGPQERKMFKGPFVPNVAMALSLAPDEIRNLRRLTNAHYIAPRRVVDATAGSGRSITRTQVELVAARVSTINECFY